MGRKRTYQGGKKTRTRNSQRGRPRLDDSEKKRTVSISITQFQLKTLDAIANMDDCSRSEVLQALIEGAGFLKAGIIHGSEIKAHVSEYQTWTGPKTGKKACNPSNLKGMCQNQACQAIYSKEGLV